MLKDWKELFEAVAAKDYAKTLKSFLDDEYQNHTVYPPRDMVYQAFKLTKPEDLKVVIIGQDPYHNPGQAMGLSFSVPRGLRIPPSLVNIYKEIEDDLRIPMNYQCGDLTPWAQQGVLLLNAYLTVRANAPLSHARAEYESFMADVMRYIDQLDQPIVFLLWGGFAKKFKSFITNPKHIAFCSSHPSPMAANHGGWFKNHHFSQCNAYLVDNGVAPIDWRIE